MDQITSVVQSRAKIMHYRFDLNLNNHPITVGISIERGEISPNSGIMKIEYLLYGAHKAYSNFLELAYIVRDVFEKEKLLRLEGNIVKPTPHTIILDKIDLDDSSGYYEAILKQIRFLAED